MHSYLLLERMVCYHSAYLASNLNSRIQKWIQIMFLQIDPFLFASLQFRSDTGAGHVLKGRQGTHQCYEV